MSSVIRALGKEDLSHIPLSQWTTWVKGAKSRKGILALVGTVVIRIYFDPERLCNQCVRIWKPVGDAHPQPEKFSQVWNGKEWKERPTREVVMGMAYLAYTLLRDHFDGVPPPGTTPADGEGDGGGGGDDFDQEEAWGARPSTLWNTFIDKVEDYHKTTTEDLFHAVWDAIPQRNH